MFHVGLQDTLCRTFLAKVEEPKERTLALPPQTCTPYFIDERGLIPPPAGPTETGLRMEIDRISASQLTTERFFKWYVHPNRPVIISGAADALFHDFPDAWTPDALSNAAYSELKQPVITKQARVLGSSGSPDANLTIKEIFEYPSRAIMFRSVAFGVLRQDSQSLEMFAPELQLQQTYFRKLREPRSPNVFLNTANESDGFNLHLSNQGGALPHSHHSTLNVCMYGAKRWILVNPFDYTSSSAREAFEMMTIVGDAAMGVTSQDWFIENATRELERLRVPYLDFVLNVGEAIYIPNFWTHATVDICRETVGVELTGHTVTSGDIPEGTNRFHHDYTEEYIDVYHSD